MDKLKPNDPRAESKTAVINGKTYHYLLANPASGKSKDTVLLLHGFPDLSLGWRFQVPALLSLNLRVIVPDLLGYGGTDAPEDPKEYTLKKIAADMAGLVAQVCGDETTQVILGGHDWGGALAWRVVLWQPQLIKAVFSVCVPYFPPNPNFVELKDMIDAGHMKNFAYQLQFAGPEVENAVKTRQQIRNFLNAMYGGPSPTDPTPVFDARTGLRLDAIAGRRDSPFFTAEELDFYAERYARTGMRGPLNWYRTRKLLQEEELELVKRGPEAFKINIPTLFVGATKDTALPPSLADGMPQWCPRMRRETVESSHWALWQAAGEVNRILGSWIEEDLKG